MIFSHFPCVVRGLCIKIPEVEVTCKNHTFASREQKVTDKMSDT